MVHAKRRRMRIRRVARAASIASLSLITLLGGAAPAGADRPPPRIEVAFALDATGSMGPTIAQARATIGEIAAQLATGTPKPDVRFGLVAYRDKGDAFVTQVHPFTRDIDEMRRSLEATQADGGGDVPEAVLEGLNDAVTRLAWTPPEDAGVIRLVYLVGDALPHAYPDTPSEATVTAEARRRHITIHAIVCGHDIAPVESNFEVLARHTEGRVFRLGSVIHAGAIGDDRRSESLAAALTDTTKAYSSSIGVSFDDSAPIATTALDAPRVAATGLVGAHARWVRDEKTWSDVWTAHASLEPAATRPAPPPVDFTKNHVLVLGGRDGGLDLEAVVAKGDRRAARVHASASPGVRFVLVPTANAANAEAK